MSCDVTFLCGPLLNAHNEHFQTQIFSMCVFVVFLILQSVCIFVHLLSKSFGSAPSTIFI